MSSKTSDEFANAPASSTAKKTTTRASSSRASSTRSASSSAPTLARATSSLNTDTSVPTLLPGVMPTANTLPTPTPTTAVKSAQKDSGGMSTGAIVGIIAAAVVVILGILAFFIVKNKKKKAAMMNRQPDPFTMGFGSENDYTKSPTQPAYGNSSPYGASNYSSPPMQESMHNNSGYQHQYGTSQNNMAAPTSPTSPTYYGNNNMNAMNSNHQFHDANNHIIAESMMTSPVNSSPANNGYAPYNNMDTGYGYNNNMNAYQAPPPPLVQQPPPPVHMAEPILSASLTPAPPIIPVTAVAAAAPVLFKPTQAGSLGVFYVVATYSPTLSDEIDIQAGDQVEILVEYDDGWCQGINLSRGLAKGVFPKHCVSSNLPGASPPMGLQVEAPNMNKNAMKRVSSMYIA